MTTETDFDIAVQRLTAWIRDYGGEKTPVFIGDLSIVLLAAQDAVKLAAEVERLGNLWKCVGCGAQFDRQPNDEDVLHCTSCALAQQRLGRMKEMNSEIERLQLYERAMQSMAAQMVHPKMTAEEMAKMQLGES